jgi:putative acyl-CoA dehydrogenase
VRGGARPRANPPTVSTGGPIGYNVWVSSSRFSAHEVFNQPSPLAPYDMYATDLALREGLQRAGGGFAAEHVARFGPVAGGELMALGVTANENKPRFRPFDAYGHR